MDDLKNNKEGLLELYWIEGRSPFQETPAGEGETFVGERGNICGRVGEHLRERDK